VSLEHEIDIKLSEKKEQEITAAKLAERDKILANLAHSIKNLISSVQSPLYSVVKSAGLDDYNKLCVEDALKGLNLIKEIAFAIDHSYTGSIDDFRFDAKCADHEGETLQTLTTKALMHSINNMFDPDYFEVFSFNYFPEDAREEEVAARKEYEELIKDYDIDKISAWLNRYFFDFKFEVDFSREFKLKDTKSSATKFFMMMQEILLNAVKYSSFTGRGRRFLNIRMSNKQDEIHIEVKNSMNASIKEKTTGKGSIVIAQFAKILGAEPKIEKLEDKGTFEIKIDFENFWKESGVTYTPAHESELLQASEKTAVYNTKKKEQK
jgi:two-component sensor histidine kinase